MNEKQATGITRGPWVSFDNPNSNYGREVVADGATKAKRVVCRCSGPDHLANARAIAAVPELLSSLKEIVDFCDDPNGDENPETLADGLARMLPAARAALAKTVQG